MTVAMPSCSLQIATIFALNMTYLMALLLLSTPFVSRTAAVCLAMMTMTKPRH
jgi:hypothetical protein